MRPELSLREAFLLALVPSWDVVPRLRLDEYVRTKSPFETVSEMNAALKTPAVTKEWNQRHYGSSSIQLVSSLREFAPEVFDFWDEETLRDAEADLLAQGQVAYPWRLLAMNPLLSDDFFLSFLSMVESSAGYIDFFLARTHFLFNPVAPQNMSLVTMKTFDQLLGGWDLSGTPFTVVKESLQKDADQQLSTIELNYVGEELRTTPSPIASLALVDRFRLVEWMIEEVERWKTEALVRAGAGAGASKMNLMILSSLEQALQLFLSARADVSKTGKVTKKLRAKTRDAIDLFLSSAAVAESSFGPEYGKNMLLYSIQSYLQMEDDDTVDLFDAFFEYVDAFAGRSRDDIFAFASEHTNMLRRLEQRVGLAPRTYMLDRVL